MPSLRSGAATFAALFRSEQFELLQTKLSWVRFVHPLYTLSGGEILAKLVRVSMVLTGRFEFIEKDLTFHVVLRPKRGSLFDKVGISVGVVIKFGGQIVCEI